MYLLSYFIPICPILHCCVPLSLLYLSLPHEIHKLCLIGSGFKDKAKFSKNKQTNKQPHQMMLTPIDHLFMPLQYVT